MIINEYALVFSGGGVKGSYEIGVWQAIRETGFENLITGVSGTSVGALNSALFVQGDLERACRVWASIRQKDIISIDIKKVRDIFGNIISNNDKRIQKISDILRLKKDLESLRIFDVIKKGRLKEIIEENISQECIRKKRKKIFATCSKIISPDTDIEKIILSQAVKYILKNFKNIDALDLQKSCVDALRDVCQKVYFDIVETRFRTENILMASAGFPIAFDETIINGDRYIDGGIFDNTPVKPLYDLGYRKFICVYLDTWQRVDKSQFQGSSFIEIYPSDKDFNRLDRVLLVDEETIERQRILGFTDGLKVLKHLED